MNANKLTEKEFWDNYWKNYWKARNGKVSEIKRTTRMSTVNSILNIFDKYLPENSSFHILEIGGSPGHYLIYMAKKFKYHLHSLDYSKIGNEQTIENMQAAGFPIKVYERDLFSENFNKDMQLFDIVYSLGFVEHFEDLNIVVKKHTELLKPGGILLLGVPNLGGIYSLFLKKTAPQLLAMHNTNSMKINNWKKFENELNLIPLFKGYIGGFDPRIMLKIEKNNLTNRFLNFLVKGLILSFSSKLNCLKKFNSRFWSGYLIGIYKK